MIITNYEHEQAMECQDNEYYIVYQNFKNNKYKATHKRIRPIEFFTLPKIFIYKDSVDIVLGNQFRREKIIN